MPDTGLAARPLEAGLLLVRLRAVQWEAEGINSYVLEPVGEGHLPPFTAGAHLDLHMAEGLVRSYSLLNDPRDADRYVIGVHADPNSRGGSRHVHDMLRPGAVLTVSAPRNSFPLHEDAPHSVLIAGGIGVTPLLSMAEQLHTLGRSWEIHYATRTRARTAFIDRLRRLAGGADGRVSFYHDGEPGGTALDIAALFQAMQGPMRICIAAAHCRCCRRTRRPRRAGPPATCMSNTSPPAKRPPPMAVTTIVMARSGQRVPVAPGQTMLAALLDAGAGVSFSCSEGVCGTCETAVLAGVPDHRDAFLTDEEKAANKTVMVCCSGSRTPELVLDL